MDNNIHDISENEITEELSVNGESAAEITEELTAAKKKGSSVASIAGFILSLVSLIPVLNILSWLPSLILSIIGWARSKKQNRKKCLAVSAVIIDLVILLVSAALIVGIAIYFSGDAEGFESYKKLEKENDWIKVTDEYVIIDTNPDDVINKNNQEALWQIEVINDDLIFEEGLYDRMMDTSFLDGTHSEKNETDEYSVSWWYHPNYGLEVTYKVIEK
ncbi:MAG: hypothetical protein E7591_03210 [Ruminococcaceae bacterium]|nr:hypothetical protein [Oscillospiraceae bacterium]